MPLSEITAAETTTLTAPRQSSQLLQLLRLVLQGGSRDLRRYLARAGDPNARVYRALQNGSFYVSHEEYTGPGGMAEVSLLAASCFKGRAEHATLLIDAEADPDSDAGSSSFPSPMYAAASKNDVSLMTLLESRGARVDCDGCTPLMIASDLGKLDAAKWLVDHGADVSAATLVSTSKGGTIPTSAILGAALNGRMELLRFLHSHGATFIAEAGNRMHTALHQAAVNGHAECVRFILACGFNVDTKVAKGATALHAAARHGYQAITQLLLDSGANIEAADDVDCTPLMHAMAASEPQTVTLLVTRGAVIANGRAADAGAGTGSIGTLKALMTSPRWLAMSRSERLHAERGLLLYVHDTATWNAMRGLVLDMAALLQNRTPDGNTALHHGAQQGKAVPLICALIREGVDPTTRNKAGQTPAEVASEAGHTLQATLLNRAADDKRKRDLQQREHARTTSR